MKIYYENAAGRVDFSFGGGEVNVISLDGFGIVAPQHQTASYCEYDGDYTLFTRTGARTMTISGDICAAGNLRVSEIFDILSRPGVLHIGFGAKRRKINCCRTVVTDGERYGRFIKFVLQLTADMPYFESTNAEKHSTYYKLKLLGGSFTFPLIFGRRINETVIVNRGNRKAEPVFYIICSGFFPGASAGLGFEIENKTTGQQLYVKAPIAKDEIITVDIAKRSIQSNINGNLLYCISSDTYLNNFWLAEGDNIIAFTNRNTNAKVAAAIEFCRRYADGLF